MKKGEIWYVDIPSNVGHEQSGLRPVIILSEAEANIAIIIPFTSNLQALKFPHTIEINSSHKNGLKISSVALLFQLRAIDKKRLKSKIGILETEHLKEINVMIKTMLNF